jgi:hypothetical protein
VRNEINENARYFAEYRPFLSKSGHKRAPLFFHSLFGQQNETPALEVQRIVIKCFISINGAGSLDTH